jgi:hypothetical protein
MIGGVALHGNTPLPFVTPHPSPRNTMPAIWTPINTPLLAPPPSTNMPRTFDLPLPQGTPPLFTLCMFPVFHLHPPNTPPLPAGRQPVPGRGALPPSHRDIQRPAEDPALDKHSPRHQEMALTCHWPHLPRYQEWL